MGKGARIPFPLTDNELTALFPGLLGTQFKKTSPEDVSYNCIAWAASDDSRWWEPLPVTIGPYYWPPSVPKDYSLESYIRVFELLGYRRCRNGGPQKLYEKVAIYCDSSGRPQHMARQLPSGAWTSKLGKDLDIQHDQPRNLEGIEYGNVAIYLRHRKSWADVFQISRYFQRSGRRGSS